MLDFIGSLFGWLPASIKAALVWLTMTTQSAGLAIILLTIGIRLLLYPLTKKSTESMAAMKELQPKMQELQKKYKDKPQEFNRRVMELYKENGVNPLGGCFPILIQLPFLFALYHVLSGFTYEGADRHFLLWDLTQPDPYYILPLLSGASMYFQSAMVMTDKSQKPMLYIMPVFGTVISLKFPVGLVLYWVISNLFTIGQQYVLMNKRSQKKSDAKGGATTK